MSILKLDNGIVRTAKRQSTMIESTVTDETDIPVKETPKHLYQYACAMLPVSEEVATIVKYWVKKNINTDDLYVNEEEGIEGFVNDPHVTLKYGIIDDSIDKITDLIEGFGDVKIKLGKVERFDTNPKFDVLKIHIEGESLQKLHDILSEKGDGDQFPEYKPHLTLAYIQKVKWEELIDNDFFDKLDDSINQVLFASKDGTETYIDL